MDLKSRHGPLENRLVSRQVQGRLAERIMLAPFSVQLFLACSLIFGVVWPATGPTTSDRPTCIPTNFREQPWL